MALNADITRLTPSKIAPSSPPWSVRVDPGLGEILEKVIVVRLAAIVVDAGSIYQ
jgi:hypothetical protein